MIVANQAGSDLDQSLTRVFASYNSSLQVRGKNAPQYLDKGTLLSKKYRLEKMIGGGGFGQIYRATDIDMGTVVAAKVEPQSEDAGRMVLEQMVLTKLVGTRHSPRLVGPSMIICLVGPMRTRCGPVDDLWSIYYTLIELAEGGLPWRTITDHDEIFQLKRRLTFYDLCRCVCHQ
ncbi:hypothetical protein ANCCEY_10269 [Ancylostoma ceylanicum]|uniref:Protein kinase domain-containing protein n=1 Tax=Ancylostoma ceylanicum TaxID=53326 RepID=A0A0D6LEX2_9BILA|nr:hypothetical protein ANCCEY_10269 [Ancylostoma ceylanicum]